eukprot:5408189-Karenia_brevis.AAC.1
MALCDKYELTTACSLVFKELIKRLSNLSLSEAEQIVDQLSTTVGQQAPLQEALTEVASKVESGPQIMQFLIWLLNFYRRNALPVQEALVRVVPKVAFGGQVMQVLVWLQQFHRCSGQPVKTEQDACLEKVCIDQSALERNLAIDHGSVDEVDVMRARMLMTTKFLEKVSASLQTARTVSARRDVFIPRLGRYHSVSFHGTDPINTTEKPMLTFGIGRLMEDMNIAFARQPRVPERKETENKLKDSQESGARAALKCFVLECQETAASAAGETAATRHPLQGFIFQA